MDKIKLGRTGLYATSVSFGALPVQRRNMEDGVKLLRDAYDEGVRFFDTARAYTDSEEKIGRALSDVRHDIVITSKSPANNGADYMKDLETSLRMLKTDYIDVYQFHNKPFTIAPGGADGLYDAALKAKQQGKIRFIGLTQHSLEYANEAVDSGNFDTLQFPFSYLASEDDLKLVEKCLASGMGFIAMKALSGGLLTNARAIHAFMRAHDGVVPIYGIQRREELDEFLAADREGVVLDDELRAVIEKDRKELIGSFCRGCGYCMPCPVGIPLNNASRLIQLLTRSPIKGWMTPEFKAQMDKVEDCIHCGVCATRCPYHLKPYDLIPETLKFYRKLYAEYTAQHKEGLNMNKAGLCETRLRHVDELLSGWVERGELPCVQALVIRHGEQGYFATYGSADMEKARPLREDAIFRIYSMSKVFTSVCMMILHEQGKYKMHDPVGKFIPEYNDVKVATLTPQGSIELVPPKRPIEIRDLFTMTSGIPYPGEDTIAGRELGKVYAEMEAAEKAGAPWDTQRVVREYARAPLCFHPGEHWRYGFSIDVLGALVEVMSGMKLGEFMRKHIFYPLGLKDTGFWISADKADRLVTMYGVDGDDRFTPVDDFAERTAAPAFEGGGGLLSTARDVATFARMLLGGGELNGVRIISRKSVELMRTNHLTPEQLKDYNWDTQRGYGYGLAVRVMMHPEVAGYGSVGEFAWDGMAGTWFSIDPSEDMVSVFMVQTVPGRHYRFVPLYAQAIYGSISD